MYRTLQTQVSKLYDKYTNDFSIARTRPPRLVISIRGQSVSQRIITSNRPEITRDAYLLFPGHVILNLEEAEYRAPPSCRPLILSVDSLLVKLSPSTARFEADAFSPDTRDTRSRLTRRLPPGDFSFAPLVRTRFDV